jgi:hypothetical protein
MMRPSPGQLERMADRLVRRLRAAEFVTVTGGDDVIRAKVIALLSRNFDDEAMIEAEAKAEAEKVVRQAPREMRQDLDVRKLELGLKQRLAKAKGFAL